MSLKDHVQGLTLLEIAALAEKATPTNADRNARPGHRGWEAARADLFSKVPALHSVYAAICAAHREHQAGLIRDPAAIGHTEGMVSAFFDAVSVLAKEDSSDLAGLIKFFQNPRTLAHFV